MCVHTHTYIYTHTYSIKAWCLFGWTLKCFFGSSILSTSSRPSFHFILCLKGWVFNSLLSKPALVSVADISRLVSAVSVLTISMTDGRCCSYHTTPNSKKVSLISKYISSIICARATDGNSAFFCQIWRTNRPLIPAQETKKGTRLKSPNLTSRVDSPSDRWSVRTSAQKPFTMIPTSQWLHDGGTLWKHPPTPAATIRLELCDGNKRCLFFLSSNLFLF